MQISKSRPNLPTLAFTSKCQTKKSDSCPKVFNCTFVEYAIFLKELFHWMIISYSKISSSESEKLVSSRQKLECPCKLVFFAPHPLRRFRILPGFLFSCDSFKIYARSPGPECFICILLKTSKLMGYNPVYICQRRSNRPQDCQQEGTCLGHTGCGSAWTFCGSPSCQALRKVAS